MGDKLSTEDLTGRRSDTLEDRARTESDADSAPVRSPLRAEEAPRAANDASTAPRATDGGEAMAPRAADDASTAPRTATDAADDAANEPLLGGEDGTRFERRWHQVQIAFVDEPRAAVEQADELVAELMRHLAETFADERSRLERAWSAGEDVDTEALRVALTRYRSFFQRLLAT
jgi:hypothetical protein